MICEHKPLSQIIQPYIPYIIKCIDTGKVIREQQNRLTTGGQGEDETLRVVLDQVIFAKAQNELMNGC